MYCQAIKTARSICFLNSDRAHTRRKSARQAQNSPLRRRAKSNPKKAMTAQILKLQWLSKECTLAVVFCFMPELTPRTANFSVGDILGGDWRMMCQTMHFLESNSCTKLGNTIRIPPPRGLTSSAAFLWLCPLHSSPLALLKDPSYTPFYTHALSSAQAPDTNSWSHHQPSGWRDFEEGNGSIKLG